MPARLATPDADGHVAPDPSGCRAQLHVDVYGGKGAHHSAVFAALDEAELERNPLLQRDERDSDPEPEPVKAADAATAPADTANGRPGLLAD